MPSSVPPFGESEFDMTIKANMALVLLKLSQKADQYADSIDYDLSGAASIDLPFLQRAAVSPARLVLPQGLAVTSL